jgi:hypothetical protein
MAMRLWIIFVSMLVLFGSCSEGDVKAALASDEMIEYKLQPGQYAVVVILDDQVTIDVAKKAARQRAAELTVSGGYRYFLIQSETQTQVVKSRQLESLNQEMIVEGSFSKDQSQEIIYPALRVVFQCFEKKPKGKSFKACNLIDCSKKS